MKVGDLVQYLSHASWDNGGLGVITDINQAQWISDAVQITWLDDIQDYGWNEAIRDCAQWYDSDDFKEDIQIYAEAK